MVMGDRGKEGEGSGQLLACSLCAKSQIAKYMSKREGTHRRSGKCIGPGIETASVMEWVDLCIQVESQSLEN